MPSICLVYGLAVASRGFARVSLPVARQALSAVGNQFGIRHLRASVTVLAWSRQQRGGQLLVQAEKVLHPLPLAGEGLEAVAQIHRPVQFRMGFDQRRRHRERVIQIRQRRRLRGADLRFAGERLGWRRGGWLGSGASVFGLGAGGSLTGRPEACPTGPGTAPAHPRLFALPTPRLPFASRWGMEARGSCCKRVRLSTGSLTSNDRKSHWSMPCASLM